MKSNFYVNRSLIGVFLVFYWNVVLLLPIKSSFGIMVNVLLLIPCLNLFLQ